MPLNQPWKREREREKRRGGSSREKHNWERREGGMDCSGGKRIKIQNGARNFPRFVRNLEMTDAGHRCVIKVPERVHFVRGYRWNDEWWIIIRRKIRRKIGGLFRAGEERVSSKRGWFSIWLWTMAVRCNWQRYFCCLLIDRSFLVNRFLNASLPRTVFPRRESFCFLLLGLIHSYGGFWNKERGRVIFKWFEFEYWECVINNKH